MSLNVYVVTPKQVLWDAPADEVILPSPTGQMGILMGHIALTTLVDVGVMKIRFHKSWIPIFVMGGLASVENNIVNVLVNYAERGDQIDQHLAKMALETAYENFNHAHSQLEKIQATKALRYAKAREIAAVEFPRKTQIPLPPIASSRFNQEVLTLEMLEHL